MTLPPAAAVQDGRMMREEGRGDVQRDRQEVFLNAREQRVAQARVANQEVALRGSTCQSVCLTLKARQVSKAAQASGVHGEM